jgi:hypothetical protein
MLVRPITAASMRARSSAPEMAANAAASENHRVPGPAARGGALVLSALVSLVLAGCGDGIKGAEIDALQARIKAEFKGRNQTVTTFLLSKDGPFQVSGMIYVDVETVMGVRTYYSTCLATMEPESRRFQWHCDAVP